MSDRFTSRNGRLSVTIAEEQAKKERRKKRFQKLKNYNWGIGLEHEMHIFHFPTLPKDKIKDFIIYDSKQAIELILSENKITRADKEFLEITPFEPTGRKCHGKWSLKPAPAKMPEFITDGPFSNLRDGKRSIESYVSQLIQKEHRFYSLMDSNDRVAKQEEKYGELRQYPFGATS